MLIDSRVHQRLKLKCRRNMVCVFHLPQKRRRLREAGLLKGCRSRQKPRLTKRHNKTRLEFATLHKNWTATQWSRVIFSDESRFLIHRSDGRAYVRRMVGEALNVNCMQSTVKHGGGGIMV